MKLFHIKQTSLLNNILKFYKIYNYFNGTFKNLVDLKFFDEKILVKYILSKTKINAIT